MGKRLAFIALLALLPAAAGAQNCTRGKRCGNTCIAANETCHVGGSEDDGPDTLTTVLVIAGLLLLTGALVAASSTPSTSSGYTFDVDLEDGRGQVGYRWEF